MTTELEKELGHVLTGAADRAPEPGAAFVDGVRRRRRSRERRRVAALTACAAALAVVAGLGVAGLTGSRGEQSPVAAAWSGTVPDFDGVPSPEQVWPEAVHRLPAKLPNGSDYQVYAVLGGDRYLVRLVSWTAPTVEQRWAPWVFDARSGTLTFLGSQERPDQVSSGSVDYTAAVGDHAVWFSFGAGAQEEEHVWIARLDGTGEPRLLARLPGGEVYGAPHYGVTSDSVYWHTSSGVLRVPLSGGEPELVEGSEGYAVTGMSPWLDTKRRLPPDGDSAPETGELWNLQTGERRPWRKERQLDGFACGPLLCTGRTVDGQRAVQRPDGSGYQELRYPEQEFHPNQALGGRFDVGHVQTTRGNMRYVWDLVTGEAAVVSADSPPGRDKPGEPDYSPGPYVGFERSVLQWPAGPGSILVLDLRAIG